MSEEDLARHREEEKIKNEAADAEIENSPEKGDFSLFSDMKNEDPLPVSTADQVLES